jgi:hypothetical protein
MGKYYKREVSLMDANIFTRATLDKPIENPDVKNSIKSAPQEKSDQEIVDYVVSELRKTGTK